MATPNTGIPYVPENTTDPAAGLNLALNVIDALLQTAVISMAQTAPPASPADGDLYIIGAAATGAWAGQGNNLARYVADGNFWQFYAAGTNVHLILNKADFALYAWDGSSWAQAAPVQSVFGRTGAVAAAAGDYTFAQIGAKPTTLAGYGIADATPSSHVGSGGDAHAAASPTAAGFMAAADKAKLDGVASGATANVGTVTSVAVANATGITWTGSPITTSGTFTPTLSTNLQAWSGIDPITKEPTITAGTTAQYWRGDKTWRDFATDVRSAVLTGLSTATNTVIAATDTVLSALGKLQAQVAGKVNTAGDAQVGGTLYVDSVNLRVGVGVAPLKPIHARGPAGAVSSIPSAAGPETLLLLENNGNNIFGVVGSTAGGAAGMIGFRTYTPGDTSAASGYEYVISTQTLRIRSNYQVAWQIDATWAWQPGTDNVYDVGSASLRPRQYYGANTTISTSDARLKTPPRDMTEAEVSAFSAIARLPNVWQWIERVETEGDAARLHAGPTVQAAIAVMDAHGLTWSHYAAFCYDAWGEEAEVIDPETGNVVQAYRPAGDRYSFRREELLAWIVRAQAAQFDNLAARVAAIEAQGTT